LRELAHGDFTLLYASREAIFNNVQALREILES